MNDKKIYTISRQNRKIDVHISRPPQGGKSMCIKITPTGIVKAYIPKNFPKKYAQDILNKRAPWIYEKLTEIEKYIKTREKDKTEKGSKISYLGNEYDIRTHIQSNQEAHIYLDTKNKTIQLYHQDSDKQDELLKEFLKEQAQKYITQRLTALLPLPWIKTLPPLRFRFLKSCWGKCKRDNTLTFNVYLIGASPECIDYVIIHELCHIKEHNHTKRFWTLVEYYMPRRKFYERQLKVHGGYLIPH